MIENPLDFFSNSELPQTNILYKVSNQTEDRLCFVMSINKSKSIKIKSPFFQLKVVISGLNLKRSVCISLDN